MDQVIDYNRLYLNDMLSPEHPEFERAREATRHTPEGKRIEAFRSENLKYQDGLQGKTPTQLDQIIASESVEYNGDPIDRIAKIRAIRKMRELSEKEKMKGMTKAERKAYLEVKEDEAKEIARTVQQENDARIEQQLREDERAFRKTALEELRAKRIIERQEERDAGRRYLEEEAARRRPANPAALRQAAAEALEKEELGEEIETSEGESTPETPETLVEPQDEPQTVQVEEETPEKEEKPVTKRKYKKRVKKSK